MRKTLLIYATFFLLSATAYGQKDIRNELSTFATQTGAKTTIDKATGGVSFMRFPASKAFKASGGTPHEKALNFVRQNSSLLSMKADRDEYRVVGARKDQFGMDHVILQKFVQGIPVYDGVMKVHFNKGNDIASVNGNTVQVNKLKLTPSISQQAAEARALRIVEDQKFGGNEDKSRVPLKIHQTTLYVFQKGLAQGYNGQKHLVYEVEVRNDADIREFVFVDAHTNELVEQFTGMHSVGLDRRLYNNTYDSANPATNRIWKEGDAFPGSLNTWQQSEVQSAGQMYHLMKNTFGHTSYDNQDSPMITTHNNPTIQCPNANWNGVSANYCDQTASDDVVAHEWGHAYTEYTSGLIYSWQAGALNEAYSDIWGETVDQINNYFDSGEGTAGRAITGNDCPAPSYTTRWKVGEQASGFGGAVRDMYNPNCYQDPGKVTDTYYYCAYKELTNLNDYGGVHINSGVINHSFALLVDGGTYNGQTINGIGLTKAAHIYWYAQANFMTKTTDFAAQADILEASAQALIDAGTNLLNLSTEDVTPTQSGQVITASDLAELQKVLLAVELRAEVNCGYPPLLQPVAEICEGASPAKAILYADFENGLGDWSVAQQSSSATWEAHDWVISSDAPRGRTGKVVFGKDPDGDNCETTDQTGIISLISPIVSIPVGASGPFMLAFDHNVSLEPGFDGGILQYKTNGGAWTKVPSSAFTANGYNANLVSVANGNTNPYAGQAAFTGSDQGSFSGSWGQSRVNLTALGVIPGATIQLRWNLGSDGCFGMDGWYIDDVRIYSCAQPTVQFVTESTSVNEAEAVTANVATDCLDYIEKIVTVRINKAPSAPVTVTFNAPTGTATMGPTADYSFTPNSFTLQAGTLSQDVVVRIYNDAYAEGLEKGELTYTLSTTGDAVPETFFQKHTILIRDNEIVPGIATVDVLYADFNDNALPAGWVCQDTDGDGLVGEYPGEWAVRDDVNPVPLDKTAGGGPLLIANSNGFGVGQRTWRIETAPFSTAGMNTIRLSFLEFFRTYSATGDFDEFASIEVWNGATWNSVFTQSEATGRSGLWTTPANRNITIPDAYANAAMKLRFTYTANYDYWWAIDNIKVTAKPTPVQTESAVSVSPDEQYLGPFQTAYFYDPTTGNILTKIENLTNHDYGCTTVEIDRTGTGSDPWVRDYTITKKTYKVTPTNPNPTGQYKITLYYKDSDLGTYKSSITSMGKSEGGITTSNTGSTSFAEVQVSSVFNADYAYTATFDSGFSGFGLSDAPPVGSLPVKLVKFEGKNTEEGNSLKWATASEVNSDYFAVEQATDGKDFREIAKVSSTGTAMLSNEYGFVDRNYTPGMNYYRLRMVDRDGKYAYSSILSIDSKNVMISNLYPNPVQSVFMIKMPGVHLQRANIRLINAAGMVVSDRNKVKVEQGLIAQDVSRLSSGVYRVIVTGSDGNVYHFSMVKM